MIAHLLMAAALAGPSPLNLDMRPVEPSAELARELRRYRLDAYATRGTDLTFSCLSYSSANMKLKSVPLVVYIPGTGEIGTDLTRQFNQRALFDAIVNPAFQAQHPCHLLAVSPPKEVTTLYGGSVGKPSAVQRTLRDIVSWRAQFRESPVVDTNRIYLVGYSYGGDGAYALACHYPGTFAAVLAIASVTPHPEYVSKEHPGNWWNVSNCAEYTGCDRMLAELEAFRDKVNGFGGDFRVGTYPSGGHDAWTAIWKDAKMWDWMFSKSLAAKPVRKKDGQVGRVPLSLAGMACTATVPGKSPLCGPAQAVDGLSATCYVPERPFVRSDAWTLALDRSLTGTLRVTFGDLKGRDVPRDALVETSSDGRNWKRLGSAKDCTRPCEFPLRGHVRHIRLRPVSKNPTPFAIRAVEAFGAWR